MLKRLLSAFFSLFFLGAASGTSFAEVTVPDVLKDRIALKKTARQLNIVYFLGSDTEPVPDYERRLSELLLYLQQFYGKEMQRHSLLRLFVLLLAINLKIQNLAHALHIVAGQ